MITSPAAITITVDPELLARAIAQAMAMYVPPPPAPLPPQEPPPVLLTVKEVAKALRCGESMVYEAIRVRGLPAMRLGTARVVRVRQVDLEQWLEDQLPEGMRE